MLLIHGVLMIVIPVLLLWKCKWYEEIDVWPVLKRLGHNGEIWCVLISIGAYLFVILVYYLDCSYFSQYWNFKPVLTTFILPVEQWEQVFILIYYFGIRTLVEEFFWRTYAYKIVYENEFFYILTSLCASAPYAFYAFLWYSWVEMLSVGLAYTLYARLGIHVRKHFDQLGVNLYALGASMGVMSIYFFAQKGTF